LRLQKAQAAAEAEANRKAALQAGKEAALKNKAKVRPSKPLFEIILVTLMGKKTRCTAVMTQSRRSRRHHCPYCGLHSWLQNLVQKVRLKEKEHTD
jgi:hypothetical protein